MTPNSVKLDMLKLTNGILEEIIEDHKVHLGLIDRLVLINQGKKVDFIIDQNGVMMLHNRVCVPELLELKKRILVEGHRICLSIHLGDTKMYQDLKKMF